jgi:hypothetical protein
MPPVTPGQIFFHLFCTLQGCQIFLRTTYQNEKAIPK